MSLEKGGRARLWCVLGPLALGAVLSACDIQSLLVAPAAGGGRAAFSLALAEGTARSIPVDWSAADRLWVNVAAGSAMLLDTVLPFDPGAAEQRVRLEVTTRRAIDSVVIALEVRAGIHAVARSVSPAVLAQNRVNRIDVTAVDAHPTIAIGADHTCAVEGTGIVFCWGSNVSGALASSGRAWVGEAAPGAIQSQIRFASLAGGFGRTCGVSENAELFCWGLNHVGQLGDGAVVQAWPHTQLSPVQVGVSETWARVAVSVASADDGHACAITVSGSLYCWGANGRGQLGSPGAQRVLVPARVNTLQTYTDVTVGGAFSCALDLDGRAWCWGANEAGQLGDGTRTDSPAPVPVAGDVRFVSLSAGQAHACGVARNGKAYCWGSNAAEALGTGTFGGAFDTPQEVTGGILWSMVSAGVHYTCGLDTEGRAYCWGYTFAARTGQGDSRLVLESPQPVGGGLRFTGIEAGWVHTCALAVTGALYCWGDNSTGEIGDGTFGYRTVPVRAQLAGPAASIVAGYDLTCTIGTTVTPVCFGRNDVGQLGSGSTTLFSGTTRPGGASGPGLVTIDASSEHSCGIDTTGAAWCWGLGDQGQIGNGATGLFPSPVPVTGGVTFAQISVGLGYSCGLDRAGMAYCWGRNNIGQLGDGTNTSSSRPVGVSGGRAYVVLSAGPSHTCAIDGAGDAWCWGGNGKGQLGDGTQTASNVPVRVAGGLSFRTVNTGGYDDAAGGNGNTYTCALTSTGTAYCWGFGAGCTLGNGSCDAISYTSPVMVTTPLTFSTIVSAISHSCGLTTTGEAWCWGANRVGQLGNGHSRGPHSAIGLDSGSSVPVPAAQGLSFTTLTATYLHTCGLTVTGEAYCWGGSRFGALGDGLPGIATVPVPVVGGLVFR